MVMLGISVAVGLAMSGRLLRQPRRTATLRHYHEAAALVTLALIAAHAGLLLFDTYLRPGLVAIILPFTMSYRPLFTGLGVIAGWLAVLFVGSFYIRKRIGTKLWRRIHRFTIVTYVLALVHVVGSGTDVRSPWLIATLTGLTAPIAFAFSYRVLARQARPPRRPPAELLVA